MDHIDHPSSGFQQWTSLRIVYCTWYTFEISFLNYLSPLEDFLITYICIYCACIWLYKSLGEIYAPSFDLRKHFKRYHGIYISNYLPLERDLLFIRPFHKDASSLWLYWPSGTGEEDDKVKSLRQQRHSFIILCRLGWAKTVMTVHECEFEKTNSQILWTAIYREFTCSKFIKYKKKEIATMASGQPFLINPHTLCQALCKSKCILNMLIFQRLSLIGDDAMWIVQSNLD